MNICFSLSKKNIFIFITIFILIVTSVLIPTIIYINNITSTESNNYDDFCYDDFPNVNIINHEIHVKEVLEKYKDKKVIALTFDDGPSKYTNKLLDVLSEYNIKVTFFVLGYKVENKADVIRRAYDEGHEIGIHGYTHKLLTKLDIKDINYEIETSRDIIENIILDKINLIRVPYGSLNDKVRNVIDDHELTSILWNIDSKDWKLRNKIKIKNRVIKQAKNKKIVLMHDCYSYSVNSIKYIIEDLSEKGFKFVTVSELNILKSVENE